MLAGFSVLLGAVSPARSEPSEAFIRATTVRHFASRPGLEEFTFTEWRGPSPLDRVGLHRLIARSVPAAQPPLVMLYLPGTNMNGEIALSHIRFSLPLWMAAHGVDFWMLDYRTHFVPPSTPGAQLRELGTWTNELFAADIAGAARFIMASTGNRPIFISGFSRGAFFAYLYAAEYPRNVSGLVLFDGAIMHGRAGAPPAGVYADDVGGRHLTWAKRQALMRTVIVHPDGPAPISRFKTAADNLEHVVYASPGFGGRGGLANPYGGFSDPSVLARVLLGYDRYWPNVQDYEDSFIPALTRSLAESKIPVLAFASTNMSPRWPRMVGASAAMTGSRDVTVVTLHNWGHLDVICGNYAAAHVFMPVIRWLRRHQK